MGEESLHHQSPSTKSSPPVPNLKFGKQFFFKLKKRNLKNCFPNFKFGTGGELFVEGDHWRKLFSSSPSFYGPIIISYICYFGGDWWLLFQPQSVIVILMVIGNHYFGGNRRSLAKSFAYLHWWTDKTAVQTSSQVCAVFGWKPTRFGSWRMVDQTLRIMLIGLLLQVQTK